MLSRHYPYLIQLTVRRVGRNVTSGWSQNPQNKVIQGTEHWEFVVAANRITGGMSCEETVLHCFMR